MIRRILLSLLIWSSLGLPALASTYIRGFNVANTIGSSLTETITVPAVIANDMIVLCVGDSGGNAVTQSAGGWTAYGSPAADTQWGGCWTRTATGSETSFTYTFITGGYVSGIIFTVGNTDGSVPALESAVTIANTNAAGSLAANAITPSQGGDLITFVYLAAWPLSNPLISPIGSVFAHNDNGVTEALGYVSQIGTGASITPTFTPGHSDPIQIITIGFKSSSTTPALFIGVGNEAAGTGTTTNPTTPSNGVSGSTYIAAIEETATSGVSITPPSAPDIENLFGGSPNANNFTVPTGGAPSGNIAVGCAYAGGTPTAPSGWTPICTDSTHFGEECAYKILAGGDVGTSPTWGGSGINVIWGIFVSNTGATLSIDGASSCSAGSSSSSFIPTTITTGTANETVASFANQGGSSNITVPGTQFALRQNAGAGTYLQVAAGSTSSQTFGSAGTNTWEGSTIGIKSNTAAGSTNPWTQIGSSIVDPTSSRELDLYWANYLTVMPTTFTLGSSIATAAVTTAFGNLNSTTPVDVETTLGVAAMGNPMFPSITPTVADEILLRVSSLGYFNQPGYPFRNLIFNDSSNGLSVAYDPLGYATAELVSGQGQSSQFASASLGLDAATTPTRTTANADINQAALEVFTTSLPVNSTGGWFW